MKRILIVMTLGLFVVSGNVSGQASQEDIDLFLIAFGKEKGEVTSDEEGMRTAWNFGKNLAWVTKSLYG